MQCSELPSATVQHPTNLPSVAARQLPSERGAKKDELKE